MRIILANPRGFCAGVQMAIEVVEQLLKLHGPAVYVYHEIVHNRHVVEDFGARGVRFVNDIEEIPPGSVVVYSAHGVSPAVRKTARARGLFEIDATCPLVTKVHLEVLRYARQGYTIFFIGHASHDEAIGTVGEAPKHIIVVESPEDVAALDIDDHRKVAYVTQTTLSISEAARIIAALRERFPHIVAAPKEDICYATTNRQSAVSELAAEADLVLVVGSANSSNSLRLVETARAVGKEAHLVDDETQLDPAWFDGRETVLVTAGASAPDRLVQQLLRRLEREHGARLETRAVVEEDISFQLPQSLRRLAVLN